VRWNNEWDAAISLVGHINHGRDICALDLLWAGAKMSEKLTRVRLRGHKGSRYGWLEWGECDFETMVEEIKRKAEQDLKAANAILEAVVPDDFEVDIVRGPYVQHLVKHVRPK
jgi:hypothetical protein